MNIFRNVFIHLLILGILLSPCLIYAAGTENTVLPVTRIDNPLKATSLYAFLFDVLTAFLNVLTVIAAFFIIYSGFMMVTARGNDAKLSSAKTSFMYSIIGTAVLLGATALAKIIENTVAQVIK